MGIGPTHRRVEWMGSTTDRIVDGRIVEHWVSWDWDMLGLLLQRGAATAPA